jgi:hypothetical protein
VTAEERRLEELAMDIDVRIVDVWALAMENEGTGVLTEMLQDDEARRAFGSFLRWAYVKGYEHALQEAARGQVGLLHKAHGYELPI